MAQILRFLQARPRLQRLLLQPLLWSALCFAAGVGLIGPNLAFSGYLMALLAGWFLAVALVGALHRIQPRALSVATHVGLGVAMGLLLYLLVTAPSWRGALPPLLKPALVVLQMGAAPAAGWVWITLLGRIGGAMQEESKRRAAQLQEPQWTREGPGWLLSLPAVPMRRAFLHGTGAALFVLSAVLLSGFILTFYDLALRMSPMVMLLVLGWTVGLPVYLILAALARRHTVPLALRVNREHVQVQRTDDGTVLFEAPLGRIRRLQWAGRSAPTRVALQTDADEDIVLLIGMARRPAGVAATVAPLPPELLRTLQRAGLSPAPSRRPQDEDLTLLRAM